MADDAGALLVRSGLVSSNALDDARARVSAAGGTVGEQLVTSGAISDDELTDFYRSRLLVPQVNPNTLARLTPVVVAAIPGDMAIELRAIPVGLDADNNLTVAMSDPSDRHAVDEIAFFTGAYVVRAVATQMQIAWCLAHYYGHVTVLGQRLLSANNGAAGATGATSATSSAPLKAAVAAAAARIPRAKGLTGKVNATRHRAIAPITGPVDVLRPRSGQLDLRPLANAPDPAAIAPPASSPARAPAQASPPPPASSSVPGFAPPAVPPAAEPSRTRSVSGEIRVPIRRAPSIRPPMPELLEPDEPDDRDDHDELNGHDGPVSPIDHEVRAAFGTGLPDDDEPMIVIAPMDDRTRTLPRINRRIVKTDPPELHARAGEVDSPDGGDRTLDADEPRIVIDEAQLVPRPPAPTLPPFTAVGPAVAAFDETSDDGDGAPTAAADEANSAAVIHDRLSDRESQPILLDRPRGTPEPFPAQAAPGRPDSNSDEPTNPGEVVELAARKPRPRPERRTQVGIPPAPVLPRPQRDTETGAPLFGRGLDDRTTIDLRPAPPTGDETTSDLLAAPPDPASDDDTSPVIAPPSAPLILPRTTTPPALIVDDDPDDDDDDDGQAPVLPRGPLTNVMSAVELDSAIPERTTEILPGHLHRRLAARAIDHDAVDDGWGPPGTTIPPPLLGAIPGSDADEDDEDADEAGAIPMPGANSAPLLVAPSSDTTGRDLVRSLEDATARAIEVIRQLEHAETRDQIVEIMVAHLAESHHRAGFFVTRQTPAKGISELTLFAMQPRPQIPPLATVRLDRPSTLADVVGTRLPYRGPMHDDASRTFLIAVLGACPPEILLVPVTVRERVVGVLFGEHRQRHTFDDQVAVAARAAGMALERILRARRG